MSILTFTSSGPAVERVGTEYPPCCGQSPVVLTWKHKKGLIGIACVSSNCPNYDGVLCYPEEAMERWGAFRRPTAAEQRTKLIEETRATPAHAGQRYALTWDVCPWCGREA